MNRLLNKGMSNIDLKVTIKSLSLKNMLILKSMSPSHFWGALTHTDIIVHANIRYQVLVATQKSEVWEQNCVWLFYYINFERNYGVLKPKSPCILLNKIINFNKNETESKMENPIHGFRKKNLVLQLK